MALNLQNKYPGRFDPVSADYPQGKFKNRSSPTAQDGSYMERDWLNDWAGFFGALLNGAGVSPNGSVDTARSSQTYSALWTVIQKLLPKRSFTQNDFIRIPDVPGGLIVQWGKGTYGEGGRVSFPTMFTGGPLIVTSSVSKGTVNKLSATDNWTTSGFDLWVYEANVGTGGKETVSWLAVGN